MIKNVTIGADPEFFLKDKITGEIVSSEGLIGGTKQEPKPISKLGHNVQEDNVAVEFGFNPVVDSESFVRDINTCINYVKENIPNNLEPHIVASAIFDEKYLQSKQAKAFGCEPDLDVWARKPNLAPSANTNVRVSAGHIHVGYEEPRIPVTEKLIKMMDLFLGVPSVLMDADRDRRKMYGKAGSFRIKSYGCEYRSLSNFWITSDNLTTWAFNNTQLAVSKVNDNLEISTKDAKDIQKCINEYNEKLANKLIAKFKIPCIKINIKTDKLVAGD